MVFAITLTSLCEHLLLFSHVATLKACKALGIRGLCVSARKKTACFCHYWSDMVCVCVSVPVNACEKPYTYEVSVGFMLYWL